MHTTGELPPNGGVYDAQPMALLRMLSGLMRWSTRLDTGRAPATDRPALLLHHAAVEDQLALFDGTRRPEATETARTLCALHGVDAPTDQAAWDHVRRSYREWLAANPQTDPLDPYPEGRHD